MFPVTMGIMVIVIVVVTDADTDRTDMHADNGGIGARGDQAQGKNRRE